MAFAILWQVVDRVVVGISDDHNPDIGFTTADVAPDYAVTVMEDDSQYDHCIYKSPGVFLEVSDPAYLCLDDITIHPLEPC